MAHCTVPVSAPEYSPPINYNSDLFGGQPSLNTEYNCDVQGGQYPYAEQDHLALRHLAFRNFIRPRTVDGKTVFKPVDEEQYNCECNLARTPFTSKYNNETLKFEVKSGVIKRGCDCIKRNGLQDRCPRVRHENRWECLTGVPHGCTSGPVKSRPHYANHLQRATRPPYSNPCVSTSSIPRGRQDVGNCLASPQYQNQPRNSKVDQPRVVRSQMIPTNRYNPGDKGSTCRLSNGSKNTKHNNANLSKSTNNFTNIVCSCRTC